MAAAAGSSHPRRRGCLELSLACDWPTPVATHLSLVATRLGAEAAQGQQAANALPLHARSLCSPQVNPELEGPTLPSKSDEEFRPFVRRLPEFKFWCAAGPPLLHPSQPAPPAFRSTALLSCHGALLQRA